MQFERRIAQTSKTNPKAFWKHLRRNLKTKPGIAPLLENLEDKTSLKYSDEEKANILQNQFSSVFLKESGDNIPIFPERTKACISNMVITNEMVFDQLLSLNPNKSCGPDEIHPRMLKELADLLSQPLTLLFNMTLET